MSTKSVFLNLFPGGGGAQPGSHPLSPRRVGQCTKHNFNILQLAAVHTTYIRIEDVLVRADDMEMKNFETGES